MADRPLLYTDFEEERFTCNQSGKIEASVATDSTLTGTGSTANPLSVVLSTDPENVVTTGTDGGLFSYPAGVIASITDVGGYAVGSNQLRFFNGLNPVNNLDFAEGFRTVKTAQSCIDTGISSDRVVRGVSIVNGELILDVAAEHYSSEIAIGSVGNANVDISSIGTYDIFTLPAIVINNPSDCRDLSIYLQASMNVQVTFQTLGVWQLVLQESIDGGAFSDIALTQWGTFPGVMGLPMQMQSSYANSIGAGDSITIVRKLQIITQVQSTAGSLAGNYSIDTRGLIVTQ